MPQSLSPSQRETRIPTPSSASSRGSFFGGSSSPPKRIRTPTRAKSQSGKKTSNSRGAGRNHTRLHDPSDTDGSEDPGCVGASLDMWQKTMTLQTDTYEYLNDGMDADRSSSAPTNEKSTPWMKMIRHMTQEHADEKSKWKKDLKSARQKSKQYKEELRDNLTERLKMLESKVLEQDGDISRASSTVTNTTTSWSEATETNKNLGNERQVEVVYDAQLDEQTRKRVVQLEQRLQQANLAHTFEKEHWMATLSEAEKATKNGAALSREVQGILEQVAGDWQKIHQEEIRAADEEKERLKQRLKQLEQEKHEWQLQCAKLKDDSRILLRERNEYRSKLDRHKDDLEMSKATLAELERKVELCQRQTSLAQRKATQLEEEREANSLGSSTHRNDSRQDPPSIVRSESLPLELQRAMQERDEALQEAEETVKMLEDYQRRLESDRQSYREKLKDVEARYDRNLEARMEEFKNEFIEQFRNVPISDLPHAEVERRYTESVEQRNELVNRVRQLQDQLSDEKGNWKLKHEAALSENKKLAKEKETLKAHNENLVAQLARMDDELKTLVLEQKENRDNWEKRLEQASQEWVVRLSEIQEEHEKEKNELQETMKKLRTYKENAETLANETRKQLDSLKEKHRLAILEWKEQDVRATHAETTQLKNELAQLRETHQRRVLELEKNLQEETENVEQLKLHSDEVIAEWEQHVVKIQKEKEALAAELKASNEKIEEQGQAIAVMAKQAHKFEREIAQLKSEAEVAKNSAYDAESSLRDVDNRHNAEISAWQRDYSELSRTNKALQDENSEWRQKLMKVTVERDNAVETAKLQLGNEQNEEMRNLVQQNEKLNQLVDSHGAEVDVWKRKWERSNADFQQASELVEAMQNEAEKLRRELADSKPFDGSSWKQKYDDLMDEKNKLERINEDQRQQLLGWTTKVESLESSWMERIEQLRSELKRAEQAKNDDKEELRRVRALLDGERNEVDALRAENTKLSDEREKSDIKLKEMDSKVKKVKTLHEGKLNELNIAIAEKDEEISLLKNMLAELDEVLGLNGRGVAEVKALRVGEEHETEQRLETAKRDWEESARKERIDLENQLQVWKEKVEATKKLLQEQLDQARREHEEEANALREKLTRAEEDVSNFALQINKLTSSLDQLQRAYDESKRHWEMETIHLRSDNARLEGLLDAQDARRDHNEMWVEQTNSLREHKDSMSSLIEGLREDMKSVKTLVQSSIDRSNGIEKSDLKDVRQNFEIIKSSLEGTLRKIANETSALLEHSDKMKALADASTRAEETQQRFFEQQERLVSEIQSLRDRICDNTSLGYEEGRLVLDKIRMELVKELHQKETELAQRFGDISYLREELAREKALREKAEQKALVVNDEFDGYDVERIRMQVAKALEESMQDLDAIALKPTSRDAGALEAQTPRSTASEESHSMIDEALALAQSLTDLVHGSGSQETETSVINLLENISDLMDQHDRGQAVKEKPKHKSVPNEVSVRTPRCPKPLHVDGHLESGGWRAFEEEPLPMDTPPNHAFFPDDTNSRLHVVVNDLYTRCHLLERERTQMMESTLELLQAARDASEAELQAALSTARRKSAEELLRVQEETQRGMWRMYNQLCGACRQDIDALTIENEHKSEEMRQIV